MLKINNVTLICVEGQSNVDSIKKSIKALAYSSLDIEFAEKVLLSPKICDEELNYQLFSLGIVHSEISEMDWIGYNNFILKNLYDYISTEFCLIIQWDGFILNANLWSDDYYLYDYIGARWNDDLIQRSQWVYPNVKHNKSYSLVGNGGFSFRSKKLLLETKNAPFECNGPEDAYICINHYDYFISNGIKYGTNEIADKFSREQNTNLSWDSVFGFHGEKEFINKI